MTIDNVKSLKFFSLLASENPGPISTKFSPGNDFSDLDAKFVEKYASPGQTLCDLGSGTGTLINKIYDIFSRVICIEPFMEFSRYIKEDEKIEIVNSPFENFKTCEKFDLITAFGFIQYFNVNESASIYKKLAEIIDDNGILLIKNQFGVSETVEVSSWSYALQKDYYSQYRMLDLEKKLLTESGFSCIFEHDIYPAECNHWDNTHYYCLVCSKSWQSPWPFVDEK